MGTSILRACAFAAALLLGACTSNPNAPNRTSYDTVSAFPDRYALPLPLEDCSVLAGAARRRAPAGADSAELARSNWATREVQTHVLSFDEVYSSGRLQAALLTEVNFNTEIPAHDGHPVQHLYVRVPAGFVTDFSSIPSGLAQSIHRTFGRTAIPAIAHDFLYAVGVPERSDGRWVADTALRRGMLDNGSRFWSRRSVYIATRLGGGDSWVGENELRFFQANRAGNRIFRPLDLRDTLRANYVKLCPQRPGA